MDGQGGREIGGEVEFAPVLRLVEQAIGERGDGIAHRLYALQGEGLEHDPPPLRVLRRIGIGQGATQYLLEPIERCLCIGTELLEKRISAARREGWIFQYGTHTVVTGNQPCARLPQRGDEMNGSGGAQLRVQRIGVASERGIEHVGVLVELRRAAGAQRPGDHSAPLCRQQYHQWVSSAAQAPLVERWFALITERAIQRNSFTSVRKLRQRTYFCDSTPV